MPSPAPRVTLWLLQSALSKTEAEDVVASFGWDVAFAGKYIVVVVVFIAVVVSTTKLVASLFVCGSMKVEFSHLKPSLFVQHAEILPSQQCVRSVHDEMVTLLSIVTKHT